MPKHLRLSTTSTSLQIIILALSALMLGTGCSSTKNDKTPSSVCKVETTKTATQFHSQTPVLKTEPAATAPIDEAIAPVTNYIVARTALNASDDNPGTVARPFKSINGCLKKIHRKLNPGDTIWIKNGVYREYVHLELNAKKNHKEGIGIPSGENYSQMLTFAAFPGHKPILKGSDVVKGWKPYKGAIWVRDDWPINSQQLFADDKLLTQIGGKMAPGYVSTAWKWEYKGQTLKDMIPGSFYYDYKNKKLYAWLNDSGNPNQHLMEAAVRKGQIRIGRGIKYVRISGLTLRHGNSYSTESAILAFGANHIFENIDQAWHAFCGSKIIGEHSAFVNCKFNHNGNNGMGGTSRGHRIINCETNYNNYRNWSTYWHAGGVKFVSGCHDWVLKGHVSAYNNADGIWFDFSMSNVTIEGCSSYRNLGYGIHYEIGTRGVIKNNLCYENIGRGIYVSNSSYTLIANNLCYKNGMSGIVSIGIPTRRSSSDVFNRGSSNSFPAGHNLVLGNMMVDNCNAAGLMRKIDSWPMSQLFKKRFSKHAKGFIKWKSRPELIMPSDIEANAGCFSDYNIYYRSGKRNHGGERLLFGRNWEINHAKGLKNWTAKTGFDAHSKFVKPEFINEKAYDFHPSDTCPALWFVQKADMGVRFDFDNLRRPGSGDPLTAGPYGGSQLVFDNLKKNPKTTDFTVLRLPKTKRRDDTWRHFRGIQVAMINQLGLSTITPITKGIRFDKIPYFITRGQEILLTQKQPEKLLPCEKSVKKLFFLLTVKNVTAKPFLRCVIKREDGVNITIEWKGDGKGGITTVNDTNLSSKLAWKGQSEYNAVKGGKVKLINSVFTSAWTNTNEWLPIQKLNFELLNPNAKITIFAITAENLKK